MTSDDSKNPPGLGTGITSLTGFRMKDLLVAALESPAEDGTRLDGAAGASQTLGALGRRVGAPGEGLLEDAMAPTASVPRPGSNQGSVKGPHDKSRTARRSRSGGASLCGRYCVGVGSVWVEISPSMPADEQRERYNRLATRHAGFALGDLFRRAVDRIHKRDGSS